MKIRLTWWRLRMILLLVALVRLLIVLRYVHCLIVATIREVQMIPQTWMISVSGQIIRFKRKIYHINIFHAGFCKERAWHVRTVEFFLNSRIVCVLLHWLLVNAG